MLTRPSRGHCKFSDAQIIVAFISIGLLFGCENMSKQQMGTVVGAVAGAAAGSQVGKGRGRVVGAVVGGVVGGFVGSKIGSMLDNQDRKRHAEATKKALDTGQPQTWSNPDTGNSGKVEVVSTPPVQPAAQSNQTVTENRVCRKTKQTVTLKDGKEEVEEVTACQGPNGWEVV